MLLYELSHLLLRRHYDSNRNWAAAACRDNRFYRRMPRSQFTVPAFGELVRAPLGDSYQVYGLIHDIHIDDDGLVRQLVTSENISDEVLKDNRERRIVPVEMSVLAIGYEQDGKIYHLLPPRPPLSLDVIYLCDDEDVARFTSVGRFGYFRHILGAKDTAHWRSDGGAPRAGARAHGKNGDQWKEKSNA